MGSTITTGRIAAAVRTTGGKPLYVLFEQTYCSNVSPKTPTWCCVSIGFLEKTMERIFSMASSCEGGMLRNPSGRLTPEGYLATWMRELANPFVLRSSVRTLRVGTTYMDSIPEKRLDNAIEALAAHGREDLIQQLTERKQVLVDLATDAHAVLAVMEACGGTSPWTIVSSHSRPERYEVQDASLGYNPTRAKAFTVDRPAALQLGRDNRLLQRDDGSWYCGGWQYALVEQYVRGLWKAELREPGSYKRRIAAYRNALDTAPKAPADLVVSINAGHATDDYVRKYIRGLQEEAGTEAEVFNISVTAENSYSLTHLPRDCATWVLPKTGHQITLAV